jgi:hypothetical protein
MLLQELFGNQHAFTRAPTSIPRRWLGARIAWMDRALS